MKTTIETTVQHTAGPWEITCDGAAIVGAGGGTLVAETRRAFWANLAAAAAQGSTLAERHLPQVDANARLIAAAPDLLAALESLVSEADLGEVDLTDEDCARLDAARIAIAKARGL